MNKADEQYLRLLNEILDNGIWKETRSGKVKSIFGGMMRFNLKDGLPLLTTKRVYHRAIIHELLWFLSGSTNIKYLVDNNINIWTDDAYRWYKQLISEHGGYECNKDEFLDYVKSEREIMMPNKDYVYGDLGSIYGESWRNFGEKGIDQISDVIHKLKHNPDDRRIMCVAYNPDVLDEVALPPCHVMFNFYTKELSIQERFDWVSDNLNVNVPFSTHEEFDNYENGIVPKRELSCSFTMRSNDFMLGNPFNIAQYAILTEMIAHVCNMTVGDLIYFGNDIHIYEQHIDGALEQSKRNGSDTLPRLRFNRVISDIDDFRFEDFEIIDYNPDAPIKMQLSVG